MQWPILDTRVPLCDILGQAMQELGAATRALDVRGKPKWTIGSDRQGLCLTGEVAVARHGNHAGFSRHKTRGETPCQACVSAEREYQRDRKRQQRRNQRRAA